MERHWGESEGRGSGRKYGQEPLWWFLQEGMGPAELAGLELARLNNFRGLGGTVLVTS